MPSKKETVELRGRDDAQLQADLEAAHHALFNLRFQAATRQLADVSQIAKARRRVARARTLLRERAILAEVEAARSAAAQSE
ncbi:MAG: 50S ribosomal protein L29 [Dehalococcoidia bacterium]|nr:50S ribosomal protein L29 [Dehalococcoidia bacterium]HRC62468.1 50S ribosomal protein L29 [Dehalococcoidia bacterium]